MSSIIDDVAYEVTGIASKDSKWEFCSLQIPKKEKGVKWNCPT
jgi:hypothetical protein